MALCISGTVVVREKNGTVMDYRISKKGTEYSSAYFTTSATGSPNSNNYKVDCYGYMNFFGKAYEEVKKYRWRNGDRIKIDKGFFSISRVNGKEYYNYSVYECEPLNKTFDCIPNKINVSGEFNPNVPNNDMPF